MWKDCGRLAVQRIDVGWVLADEPRPHIGLERRLGRGDDRVAETLAPAGDADVRLHLHQQVVHGREPQAGEVLPRRAHVEGDADVVRLDGRDFHGCSSCLAGLCRLAAPLANVAKARNAWAGDIARPRARMNAPRDQPHHGPRARPRVVRSGVQDAAARRTEGRPARARDRAPGWPGHRARENTANAVHLAISAPPVALPSSACSEIRDFAETYRDPRLWPLNWIARDPPATARMVADPHRRARQDRRPSAEGARGHHAREYARARAPDPAAASRPHGTARPPLSSGCPPDTRPPRCASVACSAPGPTTRLIAAISAGERDVPGGADARDRNRRLRLRRRRLAACRHRAARRSKAVLPLVLSVHGGRWYYGTRRDTGAIDVRQWAELRLRRHEHRLPPRHLHAGSRLLPGHALRHPLGPCQRRRSTASIRAASS